MAWGQVDVDEQRMRFVIAAYRKQASFTELCREFAISRPTGYEWLRRYREGGRENVVERSRRPQQSPRRTPEEVAGQVVQLRRAHPDWGARKLEVLLEHSGVKLAAATIHRILLRHDLVRSEDRHRHAVQRFEREWPNELWQMDFKSPVGWGAPVGPLSVVDDHSRYALALQGTWCTRAEAVRESLEQTFAECGVPQAMLMDHGTPWWNMKAAQGWTWLTVWLMKQGIRLYFSGYRHPQTQGKVERFHGALAAALKRRGYPGAGERQSWLDQFRHEYNHIRPHEALEMQTPASRWRRSERKYEAHPSAWEYEPGAELRRLDTGGQIWLDARRWNVSRALAGELVEVIRLEGRILIRYCRTVVCELSAEEGRSPAGDRPSSASHKL
jgi:transposase InsO family protein